MKDTPFGRITRSVRWFRFALFGVLPILLILAGGLYWGTQRLVAEREETLKVQFSLLMGYIDMHETLLRRLQDENARLSAPPPGEGASLHPQPLPERPGQSLFRGQEQGMHLPFSMLCAPPDCAAARRHGLHMGPYLSNAYTTFWSTSSFPPGETFLLDRDSSVAFSVPGVRVASGMGELSGEEFLAVTDRVREAFGDRAGSSVRRRGPTGRDVQWLYSPRLPRSMIAVIRAPVSRRVWEGVVAPDVYAASVLRSQRIAVFDYFLGKPSYDEFWLSQGNGLPLVGEGVPPVDESVEEDDAPGDHPPRYTRDGLVFRFKSHDGAWEAHYRIGYAQMLRGNAWLPLSALALLVLGVGGAAGFTYWYNRRVVAPAWTAQRELVESEAFNRTIIDTAPVALCVLERNDGVLSGNALAMRWLGLTEGATGSATLDRLRAAIADAWGPDEIPVFVAADGSQLQVAYAPARYRQQDVTLCAFTDISARAEIERTLARAKREADRASAAKSTFLATMSHEIRTPLYGVLGTLELLELTPLSEEQQRHVTTIRSSSGILLQLISDILDTTRIETGQMVLESEPFSPRHLVEDSVAAYAAMAWQKQLLLFAVIDPEVPATLRGDPGRIRQILNNLISNAIKFTETGHVIVRLRASGERDGRALIALDVADTGVGIDAGHRARLFEPFYQIDAGEHEFRGAGLGLAICMRLAKLMGSQIELDSEPGVGSRFSLDLALEREADPDSETDTQAQAAPELSGARIQVRAAHPELADNLCRWLWHWGAQARPAGAPPLADGPDDVLVDVMLADPTPPPNWRGRHVVAGSALAIPMSAAAADGHRLDSIASVIAATLRGETASGAEPQARGLPEPLGMRVLVAEDNPINRATLAHQLELLGCTVTAATDGVEALAHWRASPHFDAVLTDVNMPRLNGYGLARAIRAEDPRIRIVGVTANAMREEEHKCREAGMTSWLVKPIGLRALYRHLRGETTKAQAPRTDGITDDTGLPAQYTGLFNDAMRADIAHTRATLAAGQADELLAILHRMRGAMAMLQMSELIARFEQLEDRIRAEGIGSEAGREVESAMRALEAELAALG